MAPFTPAKSFSHYKKFIKDFEKKVLSTIRKFNLIGKTDKILVAVSGGKDSTAVLYILKKYFKNIEAITINAYIGAYSKKNLENITNFCKESKIKLHTISFRKEFGKSLCYIRSALKSKGINLNSCAICGILKRYLLNKKALQLKATKLVTGHNLDDEVQSFMINFIRNNLEASVRLGPISPDTTKKFVPRIKPLYFTEEKDVKTYSKILNFPVLYERCPCSFDSYRRFIGLSLNKLEKTNPKLKLNIINYFLKNKKTQSSTMQYCTNCSQPSKSELCRTCQILNALKQ